MASIATGNVQGVAQPLMGIGSRIESVEGDFRRARAIEKAVDVGQRRLDQLSLDERDSAGRVQRRTALLNPADRYGLERIIGERDLLQITYLHEALRTAQAVCRIKIRSESPRPPDFATGFLVAPGVLLTNHHVL